MGDNSVNVNELIPFLYRAKSAFSESRNLVRKIEGLIEGLGNRSHVFLEHVTPLIDEMNFYYQKRIAIDIKKSGERNQVICDLLELVGLGFLAQSRDEQ